MRNLLSKRLAAACIEENEENLTKFFMELLDTEVLLAKLPEPICVENKDVLPAFLDKVTLESWSEVPFTRVTGRMLATIVPANTWVHISPGSDYGKELSPWELERLLKGPEAVEEIVHYLLEETEYFSALEYEVGTFKEKLKLISIILESYSDVEEAFFVWMDGKPVIGLSLKNGSISSLVSNEIKDQVGDVTIVQNSLRLFEELFIESTPFYIKQHEHRPGEGIRSFKFWKRGDL